MWRRDGKVILSGNVHSWAERQEAEAPPGPRQASRWWMIASRSFHSALFGARLSTAIALRAVGQVRRQKEA